jgi:ElaB/YqjD/DUF883 family membrane-anchored ribosome-binding protein
MAHHDVRKDMDTLLAEVDSLRSDLADWAESVKDRGARSARATMNQIWSQTRGLRESLAGTLDETRVRGKKAVDAVQHQIEERPVASALSLLGVVAIGVLLAQLLSNRR